MAVKSGSTRRGGRSPDRDKKKEEKIKGLIAELQDMGLEVRREELKRGIGWRAVSGKCRVVEKKMIFVDKRIPQDEQISFLKWCLAETMSSRAESIQDHAGSLQEHSEFSNEEIPKA